MDTSLPDLPAAEATHRPRYNFLAARLTKAIEVSRLRLAIAVAIGWAFCAHAAPSSSNPAFLFREVEYFHRWSKNDQHEFTPDGQEDLEKWTDMMTVNAYPDVDDGDALATTANAVLENYKNHQAKVIKTNSVPRTPSRPAEHFIVVLFNRPAFAEVAFARFKLMDGKGYSFVYSHRAYGEKAGEEASTWLSANGSKVEKALMGWTSMPSAKTLHQERL
jgi:hypothetical protein